MKYFSIQYRNINFKYVEDGNFRIFNIIYNNRYKRISLNNNKLVLFNSPYNEYTYKIKQNKWNV